jgi:hypothetical protein
LHGVRDFGVELHGVEAAAFVGHAGDGAAVVLAMSLKPGGSSVTLSPWLIHTLSMPWPSGVVKSAMSLSSAVWPWARTSA